MSHILKYAYCLVPLLCLQYALRNAIRYRNKLYSRRQNSFIVIKLAPYPPPPPTPTNSPSQLTQRSNGYIFLIFLLVILLFVWQVEDQPILANSGARLRRITNPTTARQLGSVVWFKYSSSMEHKRSSFWSLVGGTHINQFPPEAKYLLIIDKRKTVGLCTVYNELISDIKHI